MLAVPFHRLPCAKFLQQGSPTAFAGPFQSQKLSDLAEVVDTPEALLLPCCICTDHPREAKGTVCKRLVRVVCQNGLAVGADPVKNCFFVVSIT